MDTDEADASQQQRNCDDFMFLQEMMASSEKDHNPSLTAVNYIPPALTVRSMVTTNYLLN